MNGMEQGESGVRSGQIPASGGEGLLQHLDVPVDVSEGGRAGLELIWV